ncbi:MAG: Gfo/Idh/MocA family oxidoreductase [Planctomycetaceae bacterium]
MTILQDTAHGTHRLNVGILGAGWFGREAHLANLTRMDDVNVLAVSSRGEESRRAARKLAGESLTTFAGWQDVLEIEAVDAVVIALTNDQHHAACLAAFEAGKHVLCEKPLGLTVSECDEIIAAAAASGKVLQVGHEMRFQRLYEQTHEMVCRDAIGDVRLAYCREYRGPMRVGWRSSAATTGGMLVEKNCHHFDLLHWLLDARPVKVTAFGGRDVLLDRELLDNAQVLVEHEGGRRAVLEICLFAPSGGDTEIGLVGSRGRIDTLNQAQRLTHHRFDLPERTEIQVSDYAGAAEFIDAAGHINRGMFPELRQFVECCRGERRPLVGGLEGRLSVAVSLAAQFAIARGETILMEDVLSGAILA